MKSPIERLRTLNKNRRDQLNKSEAMVKKMKDQAEAAAKVGREVKAGKG